MNATPAERAWNAAQSLHSAKLEGHSVTAATEMDTAEYVFGEIDAQELQRRVRARYGVCTETESEQATIYTSIIAAARAYSAGLIDDAGFIAAAAALPIVMQNPMPDHWFDDWPLVDGPVAGLQDALSQRLITADLYDKTLTAMANAGREA